MKTFDEATNTLDDNVIIKTVYCEAMDQDMDYTAKGWARELQLREEIRIAQQDYIDSLREAGE